MQKITFTLYLLCIFLFVAVISCKESPTVVNGTVVDKVTGEPISYASILFRIVHNVSDPLNSTELKDINSDTDGIFHLESEDPFSIFDVRRGGYVSMGGGTLVAHIEQNIVNNVIIEMTPKDGYLSLTIENDGLELDTLYTAIFSPTQKTVAAISKGVMQYNTYIIDGTLSRNDLINLPSEEFIRVYRDPTPWPFKLEDAPFDSVYITRGDTAVLKLTF